MEAVPAIFTDWETKTASFNLRADCLLPSKQRLTLEQAYVYWPISTDLEAGLLSASDHRMVVIDLSLENKKK